MKGKNKTAVKFDIDTDLEPGVKIKYIYNPGINAVDIDEGTRMDGAIHIIKGQEPIKTVYFTYHITSSAGARFTIYNNLKLTKSEQKGVMHCLRKNEDVVSVKQVKDHRIKEI